MREAVVLLYVVGAVVTALGVLLAYWRARRDLRRLDKVETVHESQEDFDLVEDFESGLNGTEEESGRRKARRAADEVELNRELAAAGITSGAPRWKDLSLPLDYWAKRSALRDAVASFKTGGLVALLGLMMSTAASIWSLYLPSA